MENDASIKSISYLKNNTADLVREVSESCRTVIITQNGKAAGVLLSPAAYDKLTERFRFMQAVEEGLADVRAGRVTPHGEVVAKMLARMV